MLHQWVPNWRQNWLLETDAASMPMGRRTLARGRAPRAGALGSLHERMQVCRNQRQRGLNGRVDAPPGMNNPAPQRAACQTRLGKQISLLSFGIVASGCGLEPPKPVWQLMGELLPVSRFVPRLAAFECLAAVFCARRPAADHPKPSFNRGSLLP
jgi:hypothetical protein